MQVTRSAAVSLTATLAILTFGASARPDAPDPLDWPPLASRPEGYEQAGRRYEALAERYRGKATLELQATAAAGLAYKKADKAKNRRKAERLLRAATRSWDALSLRAGEVGAAPDAQTKRLAVLAAFELAEYTYDDYAKLKLETTDRVGRFDIRVLDRTIRAKLDAIRASDERFDAILGFREAGIEMVARFRLGQARHELAAHLESLPTPSELSSEQRDEYLFQREAITRPLREQACAHLARAFEDAIEHPLDPMWSQLDAAQDLQVAARRFASYRAHGLTDTAPSDPPRPDLDALVRGVLEYLSGEARP